MTPDQLKAAAEKYADSVWMDRGSVLGTPFQLRWETVKRDFLAGAELMRAEIEKRDAVIKVMREALEAVYPACSGYISSSDGWEYEYGTDRLVKLVVDTRDVLATVKRMEG